MYLTLVHRNVAGIELSAMVSIEHPSEIPPSYPVPALIQDVYLGLDYIDIWELWDNEWKIILEW